MSRLQSFSRDDANAILRSFYRVALRSDKVCATHAIDVVSNAAGLAHAQSLGNADDVADLASRADGVCIVGGDFVMTPCASLSELMAFLLWSVSPRGPYGEMLSVDYMRNARDEAAHQRLPII